MPIIDCYQDKINKSRQLKTMIENIQKKRCLLEINCLNDKCNDQTLKCPAMEFKKNCPVGLRYRDYSLDLTFSEGDRCSLVKQLAVCS